MAPPKSSVGTIRGSIFRGKGSVKNTPATNRNSSAPSSRNSTVHTQATGAPAIQITDEDGAGQSSHHHHSLLHRHKHTDSQSSNQQSPGKLHKRGASLRRKSVSDADAPEVPQLPEGFSNGSPARTSTTRGKSPRRASVSSSLRQSIESPERPLRSIPHNMSPTAEPPPPGHSQQPPKQDNRLPVPLPHQNYIPSDPYFSKIQTRRQKVTLLVSIWIFISGLYTRADMHEDAKDAVKEAFKLVKTFESEVAQESSTSKAFADSGWGGGKSVEELWADVFSARGSLLLAQEFKHEARTDFERAVLHFPNHSEAIVGLSDILLDIYCQVIPLEPANVSTATTSLPTSTDASNSETTTTSSKTAHLTAHTPSAENQLSPPELSRLTARDRAFGLLSTLTKLGAGWDYSEAWFALARAYEESGQVEKAKEVLWWCVELEDTHPIRAWKSVTPGGFVL